MDELRRKIAEDTIVTRYIILHAPGWPGGYEPTPNTLEEAERFQGEHGGEIKMRLVSDWVAVK